MSTFKRTNMRQPLYFRYNTDKHSNRQQTKRKGKQKTTYALKYSRK